IRYKLVASAYEFKGERSSYDGAARAEELGGRRRGLRKCPFPQGAAMRSAHAPRSAPNRTLIGISALLCLTGVELRAQELPLERIQLPPGFQIEVYAHVPEARSLALGDRGTVFVGTREDSVYAIAAAEGGKREVTQI